MGSTQSIGMELHRSVGQLSRSGPLPRVPPATWICRPVDEFAANQTVTFLVEGMPLPKLIEPAQRFEFFLIRQSDCSS